MGCSGNTWCTNPLADAAAATIRFAVPCPALRSCRLITTSAPQDSNSFSLVGSARPVSQPRLTRTHAPSFNACGGVDELGGRPSSHGRDRGWHRLTRLHLCCRQERWWSHTRRQNGFCGPLWTLGTRAGRGRQLSGRGGRPSMHPPSRPLAVSLNRTGNGSRSGSVSRL